MQAQPPITTTRPAPPLAAVPAGRPRRTAVAAAVAALGAGLATLPALAAAPIPRAAVVATPTAALPVRATEAARTAGNFGTVAFSNPSATELRITQSSLRAIVNWDSFNVARGNRVEFVQPDKGSTLNRIWDANPSVIQGRIKANAEVILENTNGVIFAPTARVETGRFVATALRVVDAAFQAGLRGVTDSTPVLNNAESENKGFVSIERGAEIRTIAAGGDVLVFAPRIVNEGRIETPDGQTVLGAGRDVYLASSGDITQRGVLVRIQPFANTDPDLNRVTQAESRSYFTLNGETVDAATAGVVERINAIVAERGSINLVAFAIRQNGVLQATTAVKGRNGSIRLLTQAELGPQGSESEVVGGVSIQRPQVLRLGTVEIGADSRTEVTPAADAGPTQVDSETFTRSLLRIEGERVVLRGGAQLRVPSGSVEIVASQTPTASRAFSPEGGNPPLADDASRIVVEESAVVDVAGLRDVLLPMSRNQLSLRLFQNELADSPVQRNGVLYREEVFFDARRTPAIANVAGAYANIARSAQELSTTGGTITLRSDGAVVLDRGARLDASGGSLRYQPGTLRRSLVRRGNGWVPIDAARADTRYDELGNSIVRVGNGNAIFQVESVAGYVQGRDAGSVEVSARRSWLAARIVAGTVLGQAQAAGAATLPRLGSLAIGFQSANLVPAVAVRKALPQRPQALLEDPLGRAGFDDVLDATAVLTPDTVRDGGIGLLALHAPFGNAEIEAGTLLDLPARGSLVVSAASATLAGTVLAPGGSISVTTRAGGDITLAGARLSTSGQWVRADEPAQQESAFAIDGGSVALSSGRSLIADASTEIDASAGGRLLGATLTQGRAGAITLALNQTDQPADLGFAGRFDGWSARLSAWDFAKGGRLSVSGLPSLRLGGEDADPYFDQALFTERGFGNISLSSVGDVELAADLDLDLRLLNYIASGARLAAGNGPLAQVGTQAFESRREAVSLTLDASTRPVRSPGSTAYTVPGSALRMQAGARIGTEAGGAVTLRARRLLDVAGTILAPGGNITLALQGLRGGENRNGQFDDTLGFDPGTALWLRPDARLLAAGTAELLSDTQGRPTGNVFGGGNVSLLAQRGYVVAETGAEIDVRGFAAPAFSSATGGVTTISRPGGSLTLSTPEGFYFGATLRAGAADGAADGGSFSASVTLGGVPPLAASPNAYPADAREIRIVGGAVGSLPDSIAPGANLRALLGNGVGSVSNPMLQGAGLSRLTLRADDRIRFDDNLTLSATRSVVLDAAALAGRADAEVLVRSPYVALGNQRRSDALPGETAAIASSGDAVLEVHAALIDVFGHSALQGIKFAGLSATLDEQGGRGRRNGELRLIGVARGEQDASASGELRFAGELQLTAGHVYATTMSDFALRGNEGGSAADGSPVLQSLLGVYGPASGSSSAAPLSAAGSLALKADRIEVSGTVRQPFGQLSLQADELRLLAGAELSVSGQDQTVLLGTLVNGRRWQYRPTGLFSEGGGTKSVDAGRQAAIRVLAGLPVDKGVTIDAGSLFVDPAARLSAAGGGELLAWEFVKGVGGNSNALAREGVYAVLPGWSYEFAPYDAEYAASGAGAALRPGSQIEINLPGSALAPGRYTLMPAAYALLPGAVTVTLAADPGRAPLTAAIALDNGGSIVTGRFTGLGATDAGTPELRVQVEPQATLLARSRIDITRLGGADGFLSEQAARLDQPAPLLPADAGRIALSATEPFRLATRFDLSAQGGLGGTLEIGTRGRAIAVLDDITAAPAGLDASWTWLDVDALSDSGAAGLVIGGLRDVGGVLQASAGEVHLRATRRALQAAEVALVARDEVRLGDGSRLSASASASGAPTRLWRLAGDGAFALASAASDVDAVRQAGSSGAGRLVLEGKAALAGHAMRLDGSGKVTLSDEATVTGAEFGLRARLLALGDPGAAGSGDATVVKGALLGSLATMERLEFGASEAVDFYGTQNFQADRVVLDSPLLRGATADAAVRFTARELTLRNTSGSAGSHDSAGQGRIELIAQAQPVDGHTGGLTIGSTLGGNGRMALNFADAALASSGDAVFTGSGALLAQGDIRLEAARITATTGADQGIVAQGRLRFGVGADARTLGEAVGQGARLAFAAAAINQAGVIDAAGGQLSLRATGAEGLRLAAGSLTSAAGFSRDGGAGFVAYGGAGRVLLQADQGPVVLGGRLDVSARGDADAGRVEISTVKGALDLLASAGLNGGASQGRRGSFVFDGLGLSADGAATTRLDALAQALGSGGFGDEIDLRVRQGDLQLDTAALSGQRVTVSADAGRLAVAGTVAAGAAGGGTVRLFAGGDLDFSGRIDARSTRRGANGGDVTLGSARGRVLLGAGAQIDAGGSEGSADDAADGRIVLRAAYDMAADRVAVELAPGLDSRSALQAGEIVVEAVREYNGATRLAAGNSSGQTLGQTTLLDDAKAIGDRSDTLLADLGLAGDPRASVRAGLQINTSGNFQLTDDWNLWRADRVGSQPGLLTLRVAGDLNLLGSISDGFANAARPSTTVSNTLRVPTEIKDGAAWSLRIAAGADLDAADPLATRRDGVGTLTVANDKLVRTTGGSIELAAGGDLVLSDPRATTQQAVVYVAGRPTGQNVPLGAGNNGSAWEVQLTERGGALSLSAGGKIVGAPAAQVFGAWFYKARSSLEGRPTTWFSAFDAFRQGVGSFGGGNVRVVAGGDISSLGVVAPTSGLVGGGVDGTRNGGDLRVRAGGSVAGGTYLLGRGDGQIQADGAITSAPSSALNIAAIGPLLGLMDGRWTVQARRDVELAPVIDPATMPSASASSGSRQRIADADAVEFFSYTTASAVSVASLAGGIDWRLSQPSGLSISQYWTNLSGRGPTAERINLLTSKVFSEIPQNYLPPKVAASAFGGDLQWSLPLTEVTLFPSPQGALQLYSAQDVALRSPTTNTTGLAVSNRPVENFASVNRPAGRPANMILGTAGASVHDGSDVPLRISAGGDISFQDGTRTQGIRLVIPGEVQIRADGDIVDPNLNITHRGSGQQTTISAGGSVLQRPGSTQNNIALAGPGLLGIEAGRQVDLGNSLGVETTGRGNDLTLPEQGADLRIAAGLKSSLDLERFAARYLSPADGSASAQQQAEAFADAYLTAIGKTPAALSAEDRTLRAQLIDRYAAFAAARGAGDPAAVQQRRTALVVGVRQALGLPALPAAELAAAYDASLASFATLQRATQARIAGDILDRLFAQTYLVGERPYAQAWTDAARAAGADPAVFAGRTFERFRERVLFAELNLSGGWGSLVTTRFAAERNGAYGLGFLAADLAGLGDSRRFGGDIDLVASGVQTQRGGTITLLAPGGQVNVGLPGESSTGNAADPNVLHGAVAYGQGNVFAFSDGDFQVNSQRVFVVGQGDITIWSSRANIDAGRGANTAVTIPPLTPRRQADGSITFELPSLTVGSGIGILQPAVGQARGDIGLYAPNGEVLALDAQIRAPGRITLGAEVVRGADNISGGSVVGAAITVPTIAVSLPSEPTAAGQLGGAAAGASGVGQEQRDRNSLLLLELLGLGPDPAAGVEPCLDGEDEKVCEERRTGRRARQAP